MRFDRIAEFALANQDIPQSARDLATTLLNDTVGVAAGLAGGRIARDHTFAFLGVSGPEHAASMMFDGRHASIPGAVFSAPLRLTNLTHMTGLTRPRATSAVPWRPHCSHLRKTGRNPWRATPKWRWPWPARLRRDPPSRCTLPSATTTSQARYSSPFALAAMLVHGRIGLAENDGPGLNDPHVAALLPHISAHKTAKYSERFPKGRCSDVTVELKDGRRLAPGGMNARGRPDAPMEDSHA